MNVSSDINVSCTAIAFPPPIIEFYYNGSLLDQTEQKIYISTSVLVGNEISRTLTLFNASIWTEALMSLQCRATSTITEFNLTLESNTSYHIIIQGNLKLSQWYNIVTHSDLVQLYMHAHTIVFYNLVPPSVCPMGGIAEVITNSGEAVILSFTIKDATPPVMMEDIRWIYSSSFSLTPFDDSNMDITNFSTRMLGSAYVFSNDQLNLTISNITQALQANDSTDTGRYFLVVTNPAGVALSYIDLIVSG